jgi:pimeloyl-ACP methyl ester carboxylesterase
MVHITRNLTFFLLLPFFLSVYPGWVLGQDLQVHEITSTYDGSIQKARAFGTTSIVAKPLIVSLHTWSGDYSQHDPLAQEFKKLDWNYIHPDFRGTNNSFEACLSKAALTDLDDAIDYAIKYFNVDRERVFVVGVSGGGYASVGHFFSTNHRVKLHMAWVPIVDLEAWYRQSIRKKQRYANDIVRCTSKHGMVDIEEMRRRSPIYWNVPPLQHKNLSLYAGIDDGHTGSVPISHAIQMFNKIVLSLGDLSNLISTSDAIGLLSRSVVPSKSTVGGRSVFFHRTASPVALTIFDGGHEMLGPYVIERLVELSQ